MDLVGILNLGLIFSIFVLGMIVSFRFLGFADLTIEGSFTLGSVIFATCVSNGVDIVLSLICTIIGGGVAGLLTAVLHSYLGFNKLLSGITTLTMLYTVNLRILGKSNLYIDNQKTILNLIADSKWYETGVIIILCGLILLVLNFLFKTNFGLYLRATGENKAFVKNLKFNTKIFIVLGLVISNSLIAFSGSLFSQYVGYSDIGLGQGMLVSMLTAMIIGENIVKPVNVKRQLISSLIGALAFQFLYSLALEIGANPIDLKIIIGLLLIIFIAFSKLSNKKKQNKNIGVDFF